MAHLDGEGLSWSCRNIFRYFFTQNYIFFYQRSNRMSSPTLSPSYEPVHDEPISALPRLLMADDHHLILDALGAMMRNDFEVLAVDSSQAFIEAVDSFKPDIAVLDVSMPGGDGFTTAKAVLE